MNRLELENKLTNSNLPRNLFCLTGGLPGETYCLDHETDGKWYTYYSERGERGALKEFETEEAACAYFYSWILKGEGRYYD